MPIVFQGYINKTWSQKSELVSVIESSQVSLSLSPMSAMKRNIRKITDSQFDHVTRNNNTLLYNVRNWIFVR